MVKRLRCYLGFHRWQRLKSESAEGWYKQCRDCGKYEGRFGHTVIPGA
jgi:hypothetical protein